MKKKIINSLKKIGRLLITSSGIVNSISLQENKTESRANKNRDTEKN